MKSENINYNTIIDKGDTGKGLNQILFSSQKISQNQVFIAHIIINSICKVVLGLKSCLHLNNNLIQNYVHENLKSLIDFCLVVQNQDNEKPNNINITIREFLKTAFAELGVEIEFSGKNQYEKGVIIDVDEDLANILELNLDILKQGQTIVKIDYNLNCLSVPQSVLLQTNLQNAEGTNLHSIIKLSIQTHLQIIKNSNN